MAQGRHLYKEMFRNFLDSLKQRQLKHKLIGKDYLGTEYYESQQSAQKKRTRRWFAPVEAGNFEHEIPPEWGAWLQHRRKDAPTEEEIQSNLAKMRQTIENAKKLEKPPTVTKEEIKHFEKPSFPKYDDFDLGPDIEKKKKF